jgi:hypothetical protein
MLYQRILLEFKRETRHQEEKKTLKRAGRTLSRTDQSPDYSQSENYVWNRQPLI